MQSPDLDFDLIVSHLALVDLPIQRAARLWCHIMGGAWIGNGPLQG
jgi:hypothetical protein